MELEEIRVERMKTEKVQRRSFFDWKEPSLRPEGRNNGDTANGDGSATSKQGGDEAPAGHEAPHTGVAAPHVKQRKHEAEKAAQEKRQEAEAAGKLEVGAAPSSRRPSTCFRRIHC